MPPQPPFQHVAHTLSSKRPRRSRSATLADNRWHHRLNGHATSTPIPTRSPHFVVIKNDAGVPGRLLWPTVGAAKNVKGLLGQLPCTNAIHPVNFGPTGLDFGPTGLNFGPTGLNVWQSTNLAHTAVLSPGWACTREASRVLAQILFTHRHRCLGPTGGT